MDTWEAFAAASKVLQKAQTAEVIAAEARYTEAINAQLSWDNPATRGYNTDYWKRVGPMIEGFLVTDRERRARRTLDAEANAIGLKYAEAMERLEQQYYPEGL